MTEKQIEWTNKKQRELDAYIESHFPLDDDTSNQIVEWIDKTVAQAKGKTSDCREEVRRALFDILEKWEKKLHEESKRNR